MISIRQLVKFFLNQLNKTRLITKSKIYCIVLQSQVMIKMNIIFQIQNQIFLINHPMMRFSNSVINCTKIYSQFILKPSTNLSTLSQTNSINQYGINSRLDKSLMLSLKYSMASKKKQDKDQKKKKQKQKIKQQIGGDFTEIDLNKYQEPYKRIVQNYKTFLAKCRAGKLDASSFDDVQVRIGKQRLHVKHLAQIAPKNSVSVIVNPYDSDNLDAIQKAIKTSDDTLEIVKIQKSLSVSLPNSSIQQLKVKMVDKVKKSLNDQKQLLKKERHVCHQDLKKYEKIAQKDQLKQIQKQAKQLFDKYSEMLQKMAKQKEKQLLK